MADIYTEEFQNRQHCLKLQATRSVTHSRFSQITNQPEHCQGEKLAPEMKDHFDEKLLGPFVNSLLDKMNITFNCWIARVPQWSLSDLINGRALNDVSSVLKLAKSMVVK